MICEFWKEKKIIQEKKLEETVKALINGKKCNNTGIKIIVWIHDCIQYRKYVLVLVYVQIHL